MEVNIPFTRNTFDAEYSAEELKYRAILSRDSLFFGFFDEDNSLVYTDYLMINQIEKTAHTKSQFQNAAIAFNNKIFSVLDIKDTSKKNISSILKFQHGLNNLDFYDVQMRNLTSQVKLAYLIPNKIVKALNKSIGNFHSSHVLDIFHHNDGCLEKGVHLHLLLLGNLLSIVLKEDDEILIINSYTVNNESDFYYFVALIHKQFNLVKGEVKLHLSGDFSKVKFDRIKFKRYFGINDFVTNFNETNSSTLPLIQLNKCALLAEA